MKSFENRIENGAAASILWDEGVWPHFCNFPIAPLPNDPSPARATEAVLAPKMVPKSVPKSTKNRMRDRLWIDIDFWTDFEPFFGRFLDDFWLLFLWFLFDLTAMLKEYLANVTLQKSLKTYEFFVVFEMWALVEVESKVWKSTLEYGFVGATAPTSMLATVLYQT